jgi:hypothetical protein
VVGVRRLDKGSAVADTLLSPVVEVGKSVEAAEVAELVEVP